AQLVAPNAIAVPRVNTQIEGTLAVLHADDFARGRSEFIYEVHAASGRAHRLRMGSLPAPLAPGMRVRVGGHVEADGESVTPVVITILSAAAASSSADGTVAKAATASSVLVIMANFSNTVAPAYASAQAQQVMTSNPDSVANFFRENSYGQQLLNVTVTPAWVTMALARPATCTTSDWKAIGSAAETASRTLGAAYDPSAYNFVVYLFPAVSACGWTGLAYISSPHKAWINGTSAFGTVAIAHEMGHNFGLLHAGSVRCGTASIGGTCSVAEYGDPFDTMGNQRAMHYNAAQKSKLGWIPPASVLTHAGGAVTYTLTPLEVAAGAAYAVRIPTASANRTYWLEFRQPIGFDSPLSAFPNNGAQIRVASPFETLCAGCDAYSDDTQLVDATPATQTFNDAALAAGQTFIDATYGVQVSVLAASAGALTLQVATGGAAAKSATSTTLGATPNPSFAGNSVTFSASVTGNAPSGAFQFTDNGASIAGCSASALTGSGNTLTATCVTSTLAAGTHAIVAQYAGDSANTASTSASLTEVVNIATASVNVALAANGGVASASSAMGPANLPDNVNNGQRSGAGLLTGGGGWADAVAGAFPDWVQINFAGAQTIDHVVVYSVQDNFLEPVEPTDTMTFTKYGLTAFSVQGWNGASWVTLGAVSGNSLVKRTVSFAPYTTDRIRVIVTAVADNLWSRITEIEAWTSSASVTTANYALAANGGVASASSSMGPANLPDNVNNGQRSGAGLLTGGGGWADAVAGVFPDWVQINFAGARTIGHVVVYSVQDDFLEPVEPTDTMTFTKYGLTAFSVQGWNGSTWVTLGSVSGNNLVKRTVSFAAYTTDRIRVVVTAVADNLWSRITEIEAWGN
ncbi:MAG TPA: Ig-like domain repeat protein, partial [Rudaea sp.]|nr:Ig-like domain repeat protein [Rudaea sp.]